MSMQSSVLGEQYAAVPEKEGVDRVRLGMICFIASETIFFGMLITSYVYFRLSNDATPNARTSLDVGRTAIFTAVLLSSSLTNWLADRSLQRQNQRGLVVWLSATVVLGAIFLVGQAWEYAQLLGDQVTVSRNLFGSTFFTLTGFHGLHVFVGLVALTTVAVMAGRGWFRGPRSGAIESISLYWHFVDVVWIVIFTLIYIVQ